jgi:hypothetical protein
MASAMGATVHLHYCMGEYMGASLIQHEEHTCAKCGMTKATDDNGCCKDEHKTIKTAEHQGAKVSFDILHHAAALPTVFYAHSTSTLPVHTPRKITVSTHAPPSLWRTCPIYLAVCNFRI